MITSNEFKTGMTIIYKDNIYQIIDFQHVKPGKGQAYVRSKLRNLRTGAVIDYTFQSAEKMEQAIINKRKMQYSYKENTLYAFMDMETFEFVFIPEEQLANEKNYLLEGMEVLIIDFQGEILGINLPEKITLTVIEADPNVKGNTAQNAMKNATLETGLVIQVPLFVNAGDKVIISTVDGKYSSRA